MLKHYWEVWEDAISANSCGGWGGCQLEFHRAGIRNDNSLLFLYVWQLAYYEDLFSSN